MPVNELVDDQTQYCTTDDVERYIRNKSFSATSDPTLDQVEAMVLDQSEAVDDFTRRAWRERKVADRHMDVEFDTSIEGALERKRRNRSTHGFLNPIEKWGLVFLPHQHVTDLDSAQGDVLEVFLQEETTDITDDGGKRGEDSKWYLDNRRGVLYVDASEFLVGPIMGSGMVVNPQVRATYRYGQASADTDNNNVPDDIPRAVRMATAKLVAADLIDTDQYGAMLASGPENTPDQSSAASRLRDQAYDDLQRYRDTAPVML